MPLPYDAENNKANYNLSWSYSPFLEFDFLLVNISEDKPQKRICEGAEDGLVYWQCHWLSTQTAGVRSAIRTWVFHRCIIIISFDLGWGIIRVLVELCAAIFKWGCTIEDAIGSTVQRQAEHWCNGIQHAQISRKT